MRSIRQQLLLWLLLGMALISSLTGVLLYLHVRSETDELYNAQLRQLAFILASQIGALDEDQLALSPLPRISKKSSWEEEIYLIQIWDRHGRLRAAAMPVETRNTDPPGSVPLQPLPGRHRLLLNGDVWRIYRADGANAIIQIAQPEMARNRLISETTLYLLLPLLLQVPLLMMLAWSGVRRGLRPLDDLSKAIAQRQPDILTPIPAATLTPDLQPLAQTLNALLKRLEQALQQQRNFIADAAHELRTPIAALQLQLELLQRAVAPEDRARAMQALSQGMQRTAHLIQQLLRIARSGATQSNETPAAIPLQRVGAEALERHLALARARDIDLGVTRLDALDIRCAPGDIETVLDNLLSNAIRYTPPGGRIDLAIYAEAQQVVIEVTDTGIGIPEAERERIFDRFYRVLTLNDSATVEGAGLGLAIVKTICARYGATIEVADGPGGSGTRFTLRWPA